MKIYGEWRYSSTHYLPQYWMEVNGQLHDPRCPSERMGGSQSQSGCGGEEKNSWPLLVIKP